ncbi:hypothetical protein HYX06_03330 [Candidatus Woesearchaeota archaeon]|nr:hypothetical protein [Candidatus Woesearchaeota archaeon]
MAFHEAILGSLDLKLIGYIIGGVVLLLIVIAIGIGYRGRHAERGTREERGILEMAGMWAYGKIQRQVENRERQMASQEAAAASQEAAQEPAAGQEAAAEGDKAPVEAVKAVEQGAIAAQHEEKAELATSAIEARIIGIMAAVKALTQANIQISLFKKRSVPAQEYEISVFNEVMNRIRNLRNYGQIDQQMSNYLKKLMDNIVKIFNFEIGQEEKKIEFIGNLAKKMDQAAEVMKEDIGYARIELKRINKEERKERKHFKKELADLENALKAKIKKLKSLRKKGADPQVLASMLAEIDMLSKQLERATSLNRQLKATYAFMKKEIREMRKLLKYILANEKTLAAAEKVLGKRREDIRGRIVKLKSALALIQSAESLFSESSSHYEIALALADGVKKYFEAYKSILQDDLSFDKSVKIITVKNFVIAQQMQAFQKLESALRQSEEAVETGIEAITQLMGNIVGEASKINVDAIIKTLKSAGLYLNYEADVGKFIENLTRTIRINSRQLNAEIDGIIKEDERLLLEIEDEQKSSASDIGSAMAAAQQRKLAINNRLYEPISDDFKKQLAERDTNAAKAYDEAMRAESYAVAA